MKSFLLAMLLTGTTIVGAAAHGNSKQQACQTEPDPQAYSAWRIIDGRRCWYRGERGKDRGSLHWSSPTTKHKRTIRPKEEVPLPPTPPTTKTETPAPLTEDLTSRLNYYFAVLASQTYLQVPSGAIPLAMAGPWVGMPIPPGLQPVPAAPSNWAPPTPKPKTKFERLWDWMGGWFSGWWQNKKEEKGNAKSVGN